MKPNKSIIHKWAAIGGATAGALPIGPDAVTLCAEECLMVVRIGSLFGVSLTEAAAEGIIAAELGGMAGPIVFAALNIGYPFTIPAKIATAVGIIETLGNAAYAYFDRITAKGT